MTVWENAAKKANLATATDAKVAFVSAVLYGAMIWAARTVVVLAVCDLWGVI